MDVDNEKHEGDYNEATWGPGGTSNLNARGGMQKRRKPGDHDNDPHDKKRARLISILREAKDNEYAVRLLALGERPFLYTYTATAGVLQRRAHLGPPQTGESTRPDGTGRPYAVTTQRTLEPFTYRGDTYPPALWAPLVFGKDKAENDQPVDGLGIWSFRPSEKPPFPTNGLLLALRDYGVKHATIVVHLGHSWTDTADGKGRILLPNSLDLGKLAEILERRYGWAPTWDDPGVEPVPWEDQLAEGIDVSKPL